MNIPTKEQITETVIIIKQVCGLACQVKDVEATDLILILVLMLKAEKCIIEKVKKPVQLGLERTIIIIRQS